tara:strand:+ start:3455 stop:3631 length:177 start_codon:yes stop_codon:yes gene_type:complete
MEVGDLVKLTTNPKQGVGIVISKKKQVNPVHWIYRIQWGDGRITTGGSYHVEVINESR